MTPVKLQPTDYAYTILQDHGEADGGWGPAAVLLPWTGTAQPLIYTGGSERTLELLRDLARRAAQDTGKPTRLVRYSRREDLLTIGGSS
jgi:hypothetical protein